MTGSKKRLDTAHQGRGDRTAVPHRADPYRDGKKWPEPTNCPDCGLIFHKGRWQRGEVASNSEQHVCPACQRLHDQVPAAQITLSGDFFAQHRDDILRTINNLEQKERGERPLERIMGTTEDNGNTIVTFTGIHLAQSAGRALVHAYEGELETHYAEQESVTRLTWHR